LAKLPLVYKLIMVIILTVVVVLMFRYHGRTADELKTAEARLGWLEPEVPALCIEERQQPAIRGEYNPAEFVVLADEKEYRRAYYSPQVSTRTTPEPDWCNVPRLSLMNQHRLFLFSDGGSFFSDLWGILRLKELPANWYSRDSVYLVIINSRVKDVFWSANELMVVANPTAQGYQVIKVKKNGDKPPPTWLLDSNYEVWEEAYR